MENAIGSLCLEQPRQLMTCIMDIGETLLKNGAEVMRVEDTLERIGKAYGFTQIDVFTVTSCIILTARSPDDATHSQMRRLRQRGTDLEKVARANDLSRRLCACPLPLEELREAIKALDQVEQYSSKIHFVNYAVVAAAFTIFFGGNLRDAIAGAIVGCVLYIMSGLGSRIKMNGILLNTVYSAIAALSVALLCIIGLGQNPDKIMIGNIMLLIPGLALTTSLRDMINGDILSGLMGLVEALVKAVAIAIGSAGVLRFFGG